MRLKRWSVIIVGEYSGRRTPVGFLRFWRRSKAQEFVRLANERNTGDGVHFEVTRL